MNCRSFRTPSAWLALPACAALALAATQAFAGDAVHYQGGFAHEVFTDDSHLLIVTDGKTSSVDLAVLLAVEGLASTLAPVGDSATTFEVSVGQVTSELIDSLERQEGILAAYRVVRFRQDGQAFGVTGDLVVKFIEGTTAAQRAAFELEYNLELRAGLTEQIGLRNVYLFKALGDDVLTRVSVLWSDHRLADWNAHADLIAPFITSQEAPQDEFFGLQWHLENNGSFPGSVNADISVFDAWEISKGANVRVGMVDSGCDITHDDLAANYLGVSQNNYGGGGEIFPVGGHGTAVMGLMVAEANSIGVVGVAPEAQFTASSFGSFQSIAAAYNFAINNGVDVHNNSWGYPFGLMPDIVVDAIQNAANHGRDGKGMVIAFASGNSARELEAGDDLATLPEVLQVGATGQQDVIASYSNYGVTQDIMGPTLGDDGVGLATTDIMGSLGFNDGNRFGDIQGAPNYTKRMSGTSGASPVVTGVAALVLDTNSNLNRAQVRQLLIHTADRGIAVGDAVFGVVTRFSPRYGYGRVDAGKAVQAALDSRSGNTTWPGRPREISIGINEGDDNLVATISWLPSGMPVGEDLSEIDTEEEEIVLFYKIPGRTGPVNIEITPEDGETFTPCDPNNVGTCEFPEPFRAPNVVVIFSGQPEDDAPGGDDRRRVIANLPIAGNDDTDPQQFAIYAVNSEGRYSFGRVFDEDGDNVGIGGDDDGGSQIPPPDQGRPIDPELNPDEPGKDDPPAITATADRTVCTAPCTIEFHGQAITPNQIVDRGWSFGDGVTSTDNSVMHTYQLPGIYNAVYFVMDDAEPTGRISTKLLQVDVGIQGGDSSVLPGTASAAIRLLTPTPVFAPNAQVRLVVDTTGIGDSARSLNVTYLWDFGDGNFGSGQTAENIYVNPGPYSVLVIVTDELSTGQIVQVSAETIVQVDGFSRNFGQSQPSEQDLDTDASAAGTCGAVGSASLALTCLSLLGLGWRRRAPRA